MFLIFFLICASNSVNGNVSDFRNFALPINVKNSFYLLFLDWRKLHILDLFLKLKYTEYLVCCWVQHTSERGQPGIRVSFRIQSNNILCVYTILALYFYDIYFSLKNIGRRKLLFSTLFIYFRVPSWPSVRGFLSSLRTYWFKIQT